MFPPDADVSPYHPKPTVVDKDAKPPPPKVIKYANLPVSEGARPEVYDRAQASLTSITYSPFSTNLKLAIPSAVSCL